MSSLQPSLRMRRRLNRLLQLQPRALHAWTPHQVLGPPGAAQLRPRTPTARLARPQLAATATACSASHINQPAAPSIPSQNYHRSTRRHQRRANPTSRSPSKAPTTTLHSPSDATPLAPKWTPYRVHVHAVFMFMRPLPPSIALYCPLLRVSSSPPHHLQTLPAVHGLHVHALPPSTALNRPPLRVSPSPPHHLHTLDCTTRRTHALVVTSVTGVATW